MSILCLNNPLTRENKEKEENMKDSEDDWEEDD